MVVGDWHGLPSQHESPLRRGRLQPRAKRSPARERSEANPSLGFGILQPCYRSQSYAHSPDQLTAVRTDCWAVLDFYPSLTDFTQPGWIACGPSRARLDCTHH